MTMACGSCGSDNPAGSKFCGQCAAPLAISCPSCGEPASAGQRFCGQCASPLAVTDQGAVARIPAPASPPAAENRPASILFVDLVGFTTLSETRDAEDVRELLSGYFDIARTIIGRYGGVVEKFIGDAVMAVWGAPAAHEDDAERAVRAALEVVDAVTAYGITAGIDTLRARAGVVSGAVAAWSAPGEGLVTGDRVNTASRVQAVAEPGTVCVDEPTRRSSSSAIAYVDAGEHMVKGKADPLHLWRAERVVAGVGGSLRVDGLEARFVGRDGDLRLVKELFHACIDRGTARLVSVVGAAGVGKSRLLWEFDKYADGLADDVYWHNGRCLSYGEGVAYWALAEMVRQRFGIAEEEPSDVVATRLEEGLAARIHDPEERDYLRPRLGILLGLQGSDFDREELFAGWRLFFERLSEQLPVVLAFEDLHWADSGLLDFIDHLLDWSSERPIFVITFARPELAERRSGWASGHRNTTSLYLEPLPDAAMAEILDDLVAGLPTTVRDRIVKHAEGIPLYAVETVRSLVDRDVVVPREGVYTLVGEVGELDVPTSLTSLIAARIDSLSPAERSLVQDLSVLGGSFPRAAISAVSGLTGAALDELLSSLVRKELLGIRSDKLSPDRGQYVFSQTLLRTVAYDMLSKKERKIRHLAVAMHLRAAFDNDGEDVAEVIAAHFRDAFLNGEHDPDAESIRVEALTAYARAGLRAASLGAPATAGGIYRTAAELAADPDQRHELQERALDMAIRSGEHQVAYDLVTSLRSEYAAAGRDHDSARLAYRHARALARLNRHEESVAVLKEALPILEADGESRVLAETTSWLATFLTFNGHAKEAEPHSQRSLILAQELGLPDVLGQSLMTRGTILNFLGRHEEAIIHIEAAVTLARRHDLPDLEESALINASDLFMVSDVPTSIDVAQAALAVSRRRGDAYSELIAATNLVYNWLYTGDWHRVDTLLAEMLVSGRPQVELLYLRAAVLAAWRGEPAKAQEAATHYQELRESTSLDDSSSAAAADSAAANAAGDPAEALRQARKVLDRLGQSITIRQEAVRIAWTEAIDAAFALGDVSAATEIIALVGDLKAGLIPPYCKATVNRGRARVAAALGQDATLQFTAAEEQFEALGHRYWLARTRLEHAIWLAGEHRSEEAARHAAAAADTFASLGAMPWLERARALSDTPATVTV